MLAYKAGASLLRFWARVSHSQSLQWPSNRGRTYHLGIVMPFPRDVFTASHFFDELGRRGFIERQNLTIDYRDFSPNVDLIPE